MFGSWVLEVAIGLIFVFFLFSTICAALREGIEAWTKTRAAYLERGVRELLHDLDGKGLAREFYEHPLIQGLSSSDKYKPGSETPRLDLLARGGDLPSYIPAKSFAAALIDLAARGPLPGLDKRSTEPDRGLAAGAIDVAALRTSVARLSNQRVARALLNAIDLAKDDLDKTRQNLEAWYDAGMDRVSGWYKRSTQWIIFWIALVMAVVLNVDAIGISNFLYRNDNIRHAVVLQAEKAAAEKNKPEGGAQAKETQKKPEAPKAPAAGAGATGAASNTTVPVPAGLAAKAPTSEAVYKSARAELESLNLPIGWRDDLLSCSAGGHAWQCAGERALTVLGWLLTALAATLGAPFWFDILNKVMVIRSTVKPAEKSKPEGSEDRR